MQTAQEGEEECGFRGLVSLLRWFPWLNWMVDVFCVFFMDAGSVPHLGIEPALIYAWPT